MFDFDPQLAERVLSHCMVRLSADPMRLGRPGSRPELDAALEGMITASGNDPAEVLAVFTDRLAPSVLSSRSPRFLSCVPAAPTEVALLFDMIVSASSLRSTSWLVSSGAVAAENQVLRLLADLAGLPEGAGGVFVTGGSAGHLSAMIVARDLARRRGVDVERPVVAALSDQAHPSLTRALHVVGMDPLFVPAEDQRLTAAGLSAAVAGHEEALAAVVATAGTPDAGVIDDLEGVGSLARELGVWYHVDGSYGGAGLLSERIRPRYRGFRHADSFVVNPHSWLFAPVDCAALIYREPHLAKSVHAQGAGYLDVLHTGAPAEWNPSDYAYHLTRRARGLPLWFSLAVHGTDAYRDAVDAAIDLAAGTVDLVAERPHLELLREPELSVVLFRRAGWSPEDYRRWSAALLRDQVAFVSPTTWLGETVARLCFVNPATTLGIVAEVLDTMA